MMKNIKRFSAVSIIGLILLFFQSCDDTSDTFTISAPTAPTLAELNFTQLELDAVNTSNPALTLNWDEADYGIQAAVNYAIQFSKDDAFTEPVTASTISGKTSVTLSINEVNAAAGNAGINPFNWSDIYIRIVSSLGTQNSETAASNTVQFSVYPYFNYSFNDYYLVGNATAPGWDNLATGNNPALFRDETDSNTFYYTGYFSKSSADDGEGRFKVIETKGEWTNQWGTTYPDNEDPIETEGDIAGNPATQEADPGRFGVKSDGFYTFKINFASKEFSIESFNEAGIISPTSLEIQGSSIANTAMTPLAFDGHIWFATKIHLTPGEVEFVTGASAKWGSSTSFSGVATDGGGAIPVIVEDDYDVWFNDLTGRYILIPLNL
ncbi:SusE domain-containing protein [Polaribacter sp. Z014]|uniref:SusE domain-containing protein n=1 Tax=unclassified Polaribacter TaxID=196858 RepID=UPI00193C4D61|nr:MULTISPECIES: SusE domain-containing protein [unclassified Polaribacter]MCL7763560.1 SusE domain-containing protein [Polaribacter sp. Z014]QVY66668.1 SusE domain-containing protein [Polaribacter sp. Q13]